MFDFIKEKLRCDRHKKACKNCKYNCYSYITGCANCKINPRGNIFTCPCLNVDNSPKYSRCEYFERDEEVKDETI